MSWSATPDFGRRAESYDRVRPADENWQDVYRLVLGRADLAGRRVLDVGCGTGRLTIALAEAGSRVWGVDTSREMLAVAQAKRVPGTAFKLAPAERLPFKDAWFDGAVFWLVVHLLDRPRAFAEARRVLAADGRIVVVTFDPTHFAGYWLNSFFPSLESLDRDRFPDQATLRAELTEAGFAGIALERVSQQASLSRAEAVRRVEERHISTFDLLPPDELIEGTERARRELPAEIEYAVEWLIGFGKA